jgi:exopolysaccharide biosynthesis protein
LLRKRTTVLAWFNILLAILTIYFVMPSVASAYQVISKTSSEEIITQGAVLQTVEMKTDGGPLNVYILKADLSDPFLKIDTIIGGDGTLNSNQTVTDMAKRTGAVAAINGDFFQIKDSGRTIGLAYQGGKLVESPAQRNDMFGFGLTDDKTPLIEIFGFSGKVTAGNGKSFTLAGINKPGYLVMSDASSDVDTLNLYNSLWGTTSRGKLPTLTGVVEAVVKNGVVQQVLTDNAGVPIPADGYVLKGHGRAAQFIKENLKTGSKVNYTYTVEPMGSKLFAAVGGQALLVEAGHLPAYFTQNIYGKHARTAAGISKDGNTLYLAAVEMQVAADGKSASIGMTQEELASFLISIGVWRAVNLDGGGSTTIAARHLGDFSVSLVNQPQGTAQRRVPDAIGVFSNAPQGKLSGLSVNGPSVLLAGTGGKFEVKGYDQYYNPCRVSSDNISFTVPPDAGKFQGNVLIPAKSGNVKVTATLGSASGTAVVKVFGPEMLSELLINPSPVKIEPGSSIQLSAKVKTVSGEYFDLKPEEINWSVSDKLGEITDGKFTAAKDASSGSIKASYQGLTVSVPASVKSPWEELKVDPGRESKISMDDWVEVQFPTGTTSGQVEIRLAYESSFSDVPSGMSVLGSVALNPVEGQEVTLYTPWRINWLFSKEVLNHRPVILLYDMNKKKWQEQPASIEGDGTVKTISAKVWGFGRLVLADDTRSVPVFKDTAGHWASPAIGQLALKGILNGFPDGSYGPDQAVTRAQFVSSLSAALMWPAPDNTTAFSDYIPDWARSAMEAAVARGVINGYPDGTIRPDNKITRSEMAVMIDRALSLGEPEGRMSYKDLNIIPDYALGAVWRISEAGLLQGSEGYFNPLQGATRAEMAVAVDGVLNWWTENP